MKKFEKWMNARNLLCLALMAFWFTDLVLTIVGMVRGYSTMTSVERKLAHSDVMIDFLWIFGLSVELTLKSAVLKLYDSYLKLLDIVFMLTNHDAVTATTEKPEGLEEGVALKAE